jgi:hypothetical protein
MAVVDRRGCDGCGRSVPVDELSAVTLAGDEQAVCCARCRDHMESVVREATATGGPESGLLGECSGCGEKLAVDALTALELPDGETVACCESCHEHARSIARQTSVSGDRGACAGCDESFHVDALTVVELEDGETVACCEECASYARAATQQPLSEDGQSDGSGASASTNSTNSSANSTNPSANSTNSSTNSTNPSARSPSDDEVSAETEEVDGTDSGALERRDEPAVCDQCGDWVDVELFEVVTVDDRTEAFCPPCKDRARREGVVKEVRMRRAEAYATLDLPVDADESRIRDAYLSKIKRVHPDTDARSEAAFRRVQRAYERLTD